MKPPQMMIMEGKCHIQHKMLDARVTTTAVWVAGQPGSVRITQLDINGPEALAMNLMDILDDPETRKALREGADMMAEDGDNRRPAKFDA